MEKRKISKEDLHLNFEIINSGTSSSIRKPTDTCGDGTNNTCNTINGENSPYTCDTTLTSIMEVCKTQGNADACNPASYVCNTIKSQSLNCNSLSNADICCPITYGVACRDTVNNCITYGICGNSQDVCLETQYEGCNASQMVACATTFSEKCLNISDECLLTSQGC